MIFESFEAAGRLLADKLAEAGIGAGAVVVGLGDEGRAVAAPIADRLAAPVGTARVRPLSFPWRTDFAFGAVTDDDHHFVDAEIAADVGLGAREVAQIAREALAALRAPGAPRTERPPVTGVPVVLVAHALSTGYRALAAAVSLRAAGASDVVVASPIAAGDAAVRVAASARLVTLGVYEGPRFDPAEFFRPR